MPSLRQVPWLIFGALVAPSPLSLGTEAEPEGFAQRADRELRRLAATGFSGAVLVALRGRVVLDAAYGSVGREPMRADARFWIASIGKQFTSVAILRCQERGLLRLEDPLSRFFPDAPAEKKPITLLQLLTHRSGLPQAYAADGIRERVPAMNAILSQPLEVPPGTRFSYSNDNYALAAAVLEMVTGRTYEDYVQDELLRPAGLKDTGFAGTKGIRSVAPTRGPLPERLLGRQWGSVGTGGMFSTTRDLFTWYCALRAGGLLEPESLSQLFAAYVPIREGSAGLGWFLSPTGADEPCIFTRGNDDFGPNGLVYAYPDREAVVVVLSHAGANGDGVAFSRSAHAVLERLLVGVTPSGGPAAQLRRMPTRPLLSGTFFTSQSIVSYVSVA
jgi:CubicO group peptidase (beta-lactamase class C family)